MRPKQTGAVARLAVLISCDQPRTRENDITGECLHGGEIVRPPLVMPLGAFADDPDSPVARCMVGIHSNGLTSIMQVAYTDRTPQEIIDIIRQHLPEELSALCNVDKLVKEAVQRMLTIAARHKHLDILEYRDGRDLVREAAHRKSVFYWNRSTPQRR